MQHIQKMDLDMPIKVWDYLEEYANERDEILRAVDSVFSSGTLILGENVKNFEVKFAQYCGSKYGVGVDNATNGIFLALKALNIGRGDEVITVSNTAVPTVSAIAQSGATPRFIDIESDTGLMNVALLEGAITSKTKCVLPVHLYGQCVDMATIKKVCHSQNIAILEDCSQSHGARQDGAVCGSIGDMGIFSFYPTKTLGAYGDAGLVTTSSDHLNDRLKSLRFYGMRGTYYAEELGYNSRLDEVQAAILNLKLKKLDSYINRRQVLASRYDAILSSTSLCLPKVNAGNSHVYYVYVVKHPDRDRIIAELKKRDIHVNISYPWPIHLMRGYTYLGGEEGDLPNTEANAKEIFSLPMYPTLNELDQNIVCQAISEILNEKINL